MGDHSENICSNKRERESLFILACSLFPSCPKFEYKQFDLHNLLSSAVIYISGSILALPLKRPRWLPPIDAILFTWRISAAKVVIYGPSTSQPISRQSAQKHKSSSSSTTICLHANPAGPCINQLFLAVPRADNYESCLLQS